MNALHCPANAGVVGLTTALKIQEKGGYNVTIIAEVLPSDPKCIKYASHWAVSPSYSTHMNNYPNAIDRGDTMSALLEMI